MRYDRGEEAKTRCITLFLTEKEYAYLNACRQEGESVPDVIIRAIYDDAYEHGEGDRLE